MCRATYRASNWPCLTYWPWHNRILRTKSSKTDWVVYIHRYQSLEQVTPRDNTIFAKTHFYLIVITSCTPLRWIDENFPAIFSRFFPIFSLWTQHSRSSVVLLFPACPLYCVIPTILSFDPLCCAARSFLTNLHVVGVLSLSLSFRARRGLTVIYLISNKLRHFVEQVERLDKLTDKLTGRKTIVVR